MSPKEASEYAEPHIKGAIIRPSKEWITKTYGRALFNRAVAALPAEHAAIIEGHILSVGWYPLETWSRFLQNVRREVKAATGEDAATFDRRNVFESGQQTLTKVYRWVFGLFEPSTIVDKLTPVMKRIYTHGDVDVVLHEPGLLVIRFHRAPVSMQEELKRNFPISVEFMLDLAGQQVTDMRQLPTTERGKFALELRISYRKKT